VPRGGDGEGKDGEDDEGIHGDSLLC
jgi:hypothetical protein